jgi:hypothetical protein
MMAVLKTLLTTGAVIALGIPGAGATTCSRQDAIHAEQEASTLATWDAVYLSFQHFVPQCDDGAISEGYSETVTRLLAKDWKHFRKLYQLSIKDPTFEKFIISHIDETAAKSNLDALVDNMRTRCPSDAKDFCSEVIERARSLGK